MSRKPDFRLLYVDDEPKSLRYFKKTFSSDFNISTAESGAEALEILEADDCNVGVLIADQRMPEMTGVQLIQKEGMNQDTPIIGLTAMPASLLEDEWRESGIDEYVTKPLEGRWFLDTVYRLASLGRNGIQKPPTF